MSEEEAKGKNLKLRGKIREEQIEGKAEQAIGKVREEAGKAKKKIEHKY
jgi:uncharacterized protein YjbJ (UPF0337 family)